MFLKSISLYGFKTFAKRTIFDFRKGSTAVLGPNGSGKSNLVDAITWAIGEQSVKSIRGRKMEEVIYHGSATQKPLGYAEVILTFDNEDGFFPLPQSEIAIMRRYYRSGESEFSINKESCRLRDIQGLLLDTGLGTTGYSIVHQGDVEYIIDLSPQQRREIFVEAAGIIKYRIEKQKTQQRISDTDHNLARLRDQFIEIESAIEPLREQAEKAKRYEEIVEEMENLKLGVFADDIRRLVERLSQQTQEEDRLNKRKVELKEQSVEIKGKKAQFSVRMENDRKAADLILHELASIGGKVGRAEESVRYLKRSIEDTERRLVEIGRDKEKLIEQRAVLESEIEKSNDQIAQKKKRLAEAQEEIAKINADARDDYKEKESLLTKERNEVSLKIDEVKGKEVSLTGELSVAQDRMNGLNNQIRDKKRDCENLIKQNEKLRAALEQSEAKIAELEKKEKEKSAAITELKSQVEHLTSKKNEKRAESEEIEAELSSLKVRINTLEKVAGASFDSSNGEGGESIAKLIQIEKGYEPAVRRALDEVVKAHPVKKESLKDIFSAKSLKSDVFLILEVLKSIPGPDMSKVAGQKGYVGTLDEKVGLKQSAPAELKSLFSRFAIIEDAKSLIELIDKIPFGAGAVTKDGSYCYMDGVIFSGESLKTHEDILNRIKELKAEAEARGKESAEKRKAFEEVEKELKKNTANMESAEAESRRIKEEINSISGRSVSDKEKVDFYSGEIKSMESSLKEWSESLAQLEKSSGTVKEELSRIADGRKALEKDINEKIDQLKTITDHFRNKDAAQSDLKVEIGGLNRDVVNLNESMEYKRNEISRMKRQAEEIDKTTEEMKLKLDQIKKEHEAARREAEETLALQKRSTDDFDKKKGALEETARELAEISNEIDENEKEYNDLREKILECELKRTRTETQLDDIRRQFEEEFPGMSEAEALEKSGVSQTGRKSRYLTLRREQESLLPVNQLAIGEYEEKVNKRDYLSAQIKDLEDTRATLIDVMNDYDNKSRVLYMETFEKVQQSFSDTFLEMFGGGEAKLAMDSSVDPLEAGVDISITIPGKRTGGISLLSGGQKALCALVLIFALLKVKPSPFYILDEVDAGLDESNVVKFSQMLRKYSQDSQFIVVTHNKGTLAGVDHFFGITLKPEEGYSKVLSVSID